MTIDPKISSPLDAQEDVQATNEAAGPWRQAKCNFESSGQRLQRDRPPRTKNSKGSCGRPFEAAAQAPLHARCRGETSLERAADGLFN